MKKAKRRSSLQRGACVTLMALGIAACSSKPTGSYGISVRVESDPGKPLPGARLAIQGRALGQSDDEGLVALRLTGNAGDVVAIETTCPPAYRAPKSPLQVVLRPGAEGKSPEFRVTCQPLKRALVLSVRAQHGVDLPVRYLGQEIARTDDAGAAHALLDVVPGDTITVTLDTSAAEHSALMPQHPELKVVVPERDEIVLFDQSFQLRKRAQPKRQRPKRVGPQPI